MGFLTIFHILFFCHVELGDDWYAFLYVNLKIWFFLAMGKTVTNSRGFGGGDLRYKGIKETNYILKNFFVFYL